MVNQRSGSSCYVSGCSAPLGVPGKTMGSMFTTIPVELACYETEQIGCEYISRIICSKNVSAMVGVDLSVVNSITLTACTYLCMLVCYVTFLKAGDCG